MTLNTFAALDSFLGSRASRRVPAIRSTVIERVDAQSIAVRYHSTRVVIAHADGSFTLNTNGHHTATTKARINDFSSARLFQRDFQWYHVTSTTTRTEGTATVTIRKVAFEDGQRVDAFGYVMAQLDNGLHF